MKLIIGNDHAGTEYKQSIMDAFKEHEFTNVGTDVTDSVDYPDFVHPLASQVNDGSYPLGILICGSGNGVCMTANKYQQVRAALCWSEEIAELAKQHNNANVVCIPARFVSLDEAKLIVKAFIETEFEGGRHERRVNKIARSNA
jgi:ribose 5-phosphate isomerase B